MWYNVRSSSALGEAKEDMPQSQEDILNLLGSHKQFWSQHLNVVELERFQEMDMETIKGSLRESLLDKDWDM